MSAKCTCGVCGTRVLVKAPDAPLVDRTEQLEQHVEQLVAELNDTRRDRDRWKRAAIEDHLFTLHQVHQVAALVPCRATSQRLVAIIEAARRKLEANQ